MPMRDEVKPVFMREQVIWLGEEAGRTFRYIFFSLHFFLFPFTILFQTDSCLFIGIFSFPVCFFLAVFIHPSIFFLQSKEEKRKTCPARILFSLSVIFSLSNFAFIYTAYTVYKVCLFGYLFVTLRCV
ncbi:hypothetical protein L873DRAFT_456758 [Choiromyces venosus 120613-1]|uniref:Uncharacterized protein n=1 Tax=Choiromyces venosus 120613-1 TaxID=1336337 RepID=A0A3N4JVK0_9PEZI|nr:hypothetical protein L873DRAFT_456758 [Choiromyces venosus 120613-1]